MWYFTPLNAGLREDKRDPKAYQRHGIGARPAVATGKASCGA